MYALLHSYRSPNFPQKDSFSLTSIKKVCQASGTPAVLTNVACHAATDRKRVPSVKDTVSEQKLAVVLKATIEPLAIFAVRWVQEQIFLKSEFVHVCM